MTFFSFKKKPPKTGFTFIELLVVVAIITIISGMIVVNFRKGETGGRLQRSAQQIVQNIRKIQNMALSSVEYQGEVPEGGYGARFREADVDSYILFADTTDIGTYNSGEEMGLILNLEKGIQIDSLFTFKSDATTIQRSVIHLFFTPPDPIITFAPGGAQVVGVIIRIKKENTDCSANPEDCKDIKVGKSGWVSME